MMSDPDKVRTFAGGEIYMSIMRFRFTIRDLFWLTLVVALAVGWSIDGGKKPSGRYHLVETRSQLKVFDDITNTIWIKDDGDHWSKIVGGHKIGQLGVGRLSSE
jgi:hypothetical protein